MRRNPARRRGWREHGAFRRTSVWPCERRIGSCGGRPPNGYARGPDRGAGGQGKGGQGGSRGNGGTGGTGSKSNGARAKDIVSQASDNENISEIKSDSETDSENEIVSGGEIVSERVSDKSTESNSEIKIVSKSKIESEIGGNSVSEVASAIATGIIGVASPGGCAIKFLGKIGIGVSAGGSKSTRARAKIVGTKAGDPTSDKSIGGENNSDSASERQSDSVSGGQGGTGQPSSESASESEEESVNKSGIEIERASDSEVTSESDNQEQSENQQFRQGRN